MTRMRVIALASGLAWAAAAAAVAEPAWGGNCLACHGQLVSDRLWVLDADGLADPDESATGAPDRGPRPVYQMQRGQTRALRAAVGSLAPGETYAVELRRLRYPGVESGRTLAYGADCGWAEWGEGPGYYTDPDMAYRWPDDPQLFAYELTVSPAAGLDCYDLVFAVAGALSDGALFYAEEHFYVQVRGRVGDLDCDGVVGFGDIDPFVVALTGQAAYELLMPDCDWLAADCDGDGLVTLADIDAFVALLTAGPALAGAAADAAPQGSVDIRRGGRTARGAGPPAGTEQKGVDR